MKNFKRFAVLCLLFSMFSVTVSAFNYTYTGWIGGGSIKHHWWTSVVFARGDYIQTEAEGYGYSKQACAKMGHAYTCNSYVGSSTLRTSAGDYGYFGAIGDRNYSSWVNLN